MKNIPIFVNVKPHYYCAYDVSGHCDVWTGVWINLVNEQLLSYPRRNINFVRQACGAIRLRK